MKTKVVLADDVVRALADQATTQPIDAFVALWAAIGVDLGDDDTPAIKPWDFAIPQEQWKTFAAGLAVYDRDHPEGMASMTLLMINKGPSSYDPKEVPS